MENYSSVETAFKPRSLQYRCGMTNGSTLNKAKPRRASEQAPVVGRQLGQQADQHIHAEGKSSCCCHVGKAACPRGADGQPKTPRVAPSRARQPGCRPRCHEWGRGTRSLGRWGSTPWGMGVLLPAGTSVGVGALLGSELQVRYRESGQKTSAIRLVSGRQSLPICPQAWVGQGR